MGFSAVNEYSRGTCLDNIALYAPVNRAASPGFPSRATQQTTLGKSATAESCRPMSAVEDQCLPQPNSCFLETALEQR